MITPLTSDKQQTMTITTLDMVTGISVYLLGYLISMILISLDLFHKYS